MIYCTSPVSRVEQHEMLQHLVFEDEFEAQRRSGDVLLAGGLLDEVGRREDALVRGGALGGAIGGD